MLALMGKCNYILTLDESTVFDFIHGFENASNCNIWYPFDVHLSTILLSDHQIMFEKKLC